MGDRYYHKSFNVDVTIYNSDVTGSCILVCVHRPDGDVKFLVDCGIYQGNSEEEKNYQNFSFVPAEIDFVILTHLHADHTGRLPLLYRKGFYAHTYCTETTAALLPIALEDDVKVLKTEAKRRGKSPLYTEKDVERALKDIIPMPYEEKFCPYPGIRVRFFKNVHVPGAASILVEIESYFKENINLFFTGDYNCTSVFEVAKKLPKDVRKLPMNVITEATYGSTDRIENDSSFFQDNIVRWINEGKKTIVCFVASFERAQTVAYTLKCMQDAGVLDTNIPIRFDGALAHKYFNAFKTILHIDNFMPKNYMFVGNDDRQNIIRCKDCQIIVTTSADGCNGPAPEYIEAFIENSNAAFHFTSYLSPESIGRTIMDTAIGDQFYKGAVLKTKRAATAETSQFSAHAKRQELLDCILQFENLRSVQITHGEMPVKEQFAKYVLKSLNQEKEKKQNQIMVAVSGKGNALRLNHLGIIKQIPMRECVEENKKYGTRERRNPTKANRALTNTRRR